MKCTVDNNCLFHSPAYCAAFIVSGKIAEQKQRYLSSLLK